MATVTPTKWRRCVNRSLLHYAPNERRIVKVKPEDDARRFCIRLGKIVTEGECGRCGSAKEAVG